MRRIAYPIRQRRPPSPNRAVTLTLMERRSTRCWPTVQSDEGDRGNDATSTSRGELEPDHSLGDAQQRKRRIASIESERPPALVCPVPMFGSIDTRLLITPGFAGDWLPGPREASPPASCAAAARLRCLLDFCMYSHVQPLTRRRESRLHIRTAVGETTRPRVNDRFNRSGRGLASILSQPTLDVMFAWSTRSRRHQNICRRGGVFTGGRLPGLGLLPRLPPIRENPPLLDNNGNTNGITTPPAESARFVDRSARGGWSRPASTSTRSA